MSSRLKGVVRELRSYPGQFWVLTLGVFVYVGAAALAFPFEGIYLHKYVGASMTMVGVVFGLVPFVVMPVQFWGGRLTDKVGRRKVLIMALLMGVVWFVGFAFVQTVWEVALLVAVESAFGWPLFQTASNAMIADIVEPAHRQEAYSINRVAMNLGVVIGPATAALALAWGASFRELFLAAAVGCLATMIISAVWIRESRPASAAALNRSGCRSSPMMRPCGAAGLVSFAFIVIVSLLCGRPSGGRRTHCIQACGVRAPCGCIAPALNHGTGVQPHRNPRASPVGRLLVLHLLTHRL